MSNTFQLNNKVIKKILVSLFCSTLILSLIGCDKDSNTNVKIDYGTSAIFTEDDMNSAIEEIIKTFNTFDGCELHRLSYSSDEECNNADNIAWMNDLEVANDNKEVFTQCIMFDSSFRSPKKGGGAWEADSEYTWSWWLARSEGGKWKLMTWGY